MTLSLNMSAICTKNAIEKRLKTQQEIPIALLRQPQGNKMPMTGKSSRGTDLPYSTATTSHEVTLTRKSQW